MTESNRLRLRTPEQLLEVVRLFVTSPHTGEPVPVGDLGDRDLVNVAALLGGMLAGTIDSMIELLDDGTTFGEALSALIEPTRTDPALAAQLWEMAGILDGDAL